MPPKVQLTASWQLNAALLSRPVDLTALVSMSKASPEKFTEDDTLARLVNMLLNEKNKVKSDKDTKLDVLNILANVAGLPKSGNAVVRNALQGISEWFDAYIAEEEADPGQEPELHKAMVLLLARCWEYKLKTEDVLELTQGNRRIALCTVVGLLEDGETYSTELKQRQRPEQGKMAQWEHELVCQRYEKPLLLQICRLLRGFTHPGTYFEASAEEIALYSIERFAEEMDTLLDITLKSRLVEKLSVALYDCLFELEDAALAREEEEEEARSAEGGVCAVSRGASSYISILNESDHMAVVSVHAFLQNLYFYATDNNEEFRRHMLVETLLIPRLVIPYLDRCVLHATILNSRAEAYSDMLEGDMIAEMALHNPQLVKGIAASLRTLIIASFRAPATQFVMSLLRKLNPTAQMLKASAFCRHHEYIFALLCLLNVNMGALDLGKAVDEDEAEDGDSYNAHALLQELASVYSEMDVAAQGRVYKRVMLSGALPISRDTPSYVAVMSVLHGGAAGQLEYVAGRDSGKEDEDDENYQDTRAEAKQAHLDRMALLRERGEPTDEEEAEMAASISKTASAAASSSSSSSSSTATSSGDAKDSKSTEGGGGGKGAFVRNVADSKSESRSKGGVPPPDRQDKGSSYRLLGDLPSLGPRDGHQLDVKVALSLDWEGHKSAQKILKQEDMRRGGEEKGQPGGSSADPTIPKEFLCAINGHVMKEPVRVTSSGLVFERATIELWLQTRGSVCPITNSPLEPSDLVPADDLRNRIKRYHIQQTSLRTAAHHEDDLYDF